MSTAEHIYNEVRTLPEAKAREALDFVARLKTKRHADNEARRKKRIPHPASSEDEALAIAV